jgi:hypothetical protein
MAILAIAKKVPMLAALALTAAVHFASAVDAATYTWIGGASAPWTTATSWSPTRSSPASNDVLQFIGGGSQSATSVPTQTIGQLLVTGNTTATLQQVSNATLTISGGAGTDLSIAAGSTLSAGSNFGPLHIRVGAGATGDVFGTLVLPGLSHTVDATDVNGIVFESGSSFVEVTPGAAFTTSGTANAIHFLGGSTLTTYTFGSVFGLAAPNSKIVLDHGSLFIDQGGHGSDFSGRTYGNYQFNVGGGGSGSPVGTGTVSIDNLSVTQGTLNVGMTGTFNLKGNVSVSSGATLNFSPASAATVTLNGPSAQTITNSGTLGVSSNETFTVNNPNGITLGSNMTLPAGTLNFVSGKVTTGGNTLTIGSAASVSGAGSGTGWVVGNLKRNVPIGGARTFDIGSASNYLPVALQVNGLAAAFDLAAKMSTPDHPQLATSAIDPAKTVNRFWTLTPASTPTFTSYSATFNFLASDVDGGANPSNFRVARYTVSTWTTLDPGTRTATSTQATGVTAFSDFAVGEATVVYTWIGGASAPWTTATSWSPTRSSPASNDVLQFIGGGSQSATSVPTQTIGQLLVTGNTTATLQQVSNATLTISGGAGTDLSIAAGSTLSAGSNFGPLHIRVGAGATGDVFGTLVLPGLSHTVDATDVNGIVFESGSSFVEVTPGAAFTTSGTANAIHFLGGSTLTTYTFGSVFGLAAPNSKIVLDHGSLFIDQGGHGSDFSGRTYGNYQFNVGGGGSGSPVGTGTVSIDNLSVTQGTLNVGMTGTFNLKGNVSVSSGATLNFSPASAATVTLNGPSAQTITNSGTLGVSSNETFTVNNPNGITLGSNMTLPAGTLNFVSGKVTTGGNTLTIGSAASVSGAGSGTGWVVGNLKRNVPIGGARTFDIGSASNYLPVALQVNGLAAAFDLAAKMSTPDHPQLDALVIDPAKSVNRYWTLTPASTPTFTSYSATFNFLASDVDGGANPSNFRVARYTASTWTTLPPGTRTATSTQATGVTAFSDFAVGEMSTICPPAGPSYTLGSRLYSLTAPTGSEGNGWSWSIDVPGTDFSGASGTVPVSPAGESSLEMVNRFVESINAYPCPDNMLKAVAFPKTATRTDLYVRIGGSVKLDLWVADVGEVMCCKPDFALGDICRISGPVPMPCTEPGLRARSIVLPRMLAGILLDEIPLSEQDCNMNGEDDQIDIASDVSADINDDGIPDECQPPFLVRVFAIANNKYRVLMDRAVTVGTAENENNYTLTSTLGPPDLATQVDGTTIDLTVSGTGLSGGDVEVVTVNGLTAAGSGLTMTAGQESSFHFGVLSPILVQGGDPDSLSAVPCRDVGRYQTGGPTTIRAIVQARFDNTYYMSATNNQRDGMAVFAPPQILTVGRQYVIVGFVQEYFDETQMSTIVYVADEGAAANPAAVVQTIPVVVDVTCDSPSPHLGTSSHLTNGEDFEDMLVTLNNVKVCEDDLAGSNFIITSFPVYPTPPADSMLVANLTATAYTYAPNQLHRINVTGILHYTLGALEICPRSDADIVVLGNAADVDDQLPKAVSFSVAPNPGRRPRLTFALPKPDQVEIGVFDVVGRQVSVVARGEFQAGTHTRQWDGLDSAGNSAKPGIYFYKLKLLTGVHTVRSVID